MQNEKIPTRQLIGFFIVSRLSFSISNIAAMHVPPYNQDQWIMVIVSAIYIIIASIPLLFLANRIKNDTVKDFMKSLYGKTISKILGLFYVIYFIIQTINILTLQTELVTTSILPESSNALVTTLMIIVCIYMTSRGIIVIFRAVDLFVPIIYSFLIVLILLGVNNVDLSLFSPVFVDSSLLELNKGAIMMASMYNDIIVIAMLIPELENKSISTKAFFSILIVNIVILNIIIIVTQGALGIEYSRHSLFPFLIYVKLIDVANIIERIAAIFVLMWLIAVTSSINITLYLATKIFRDIFEKEKDDKLMLFVVSVIVWLVSVAITWVRPVVGTREDLNNYLTIIFVIFIIVIPTITCLVYFFKRKSINKSDN